MSTYSRRLYLNLSGYGYTDCQGKNRGVVRYVESDLESESKTDTVRRIKPDELLYAQTPFVATLLKHHRLNYKITDPKYLYCPLTKTYHERNTYYSVAKPYTIRSMAAPNPWGDIRVKMESDELNLSGYIGEYSETCDLFVGTANLVYDMFQLLRGNPKTIAKYFGGMKKGARQLRELSGEWLNAHFAVAPNVNTLKESLLALQEKIENSGTIDRRIVKVARYRDSGTGSTGVVNYSWEKEITVKGILHALYDIKTQRVNFGNPIEALWEGIPFSFVVDWMIPIGQYLNTLDATRGYSSIVACNVKREKELMTWNYINLNKNYIYELVNGLPGSWESESYERTPLSGVPMASFPSYQPSTDVGSLMNALALLHVVKAGTVSKYKLNQY